MRRILENIINQGRPKEIIQHCKLANNWLEIFRKYEKPNSLVYAALELRMGLESHVQTLCFLSDKFEISNKLMDKDFSTIVKNITKESALEIKKGDYLRFKRFQEFLSVVSEVEGLKGPYVIIDLKDFQQKYSICSKYCHKKLRENTQWDQKDFLKQVYSDLSFVYRYVEREIAGRISVSIKPEWDQRVLDIGEEYIDGRFGLGGLRKEILKLKEIIDDDK
jgi:hypothetical protein